MITIPAAAYAVLAAISGQRFSLQDEKVLQREIEQRLIDTGLEVEREVHLSGKDIIDFTCCGVGIEVKINGSSKAIYKQLERYCLHDQINHIILVTNKVIRLPTLINGKSNHIVNLGASWL